MNSSMITKDECQPKNRSDWPDPECPYGLIIGGDDSCYHVKGYPIPPEHLMDHKDNDLEIVSPETCKENPEHPFCWGNVNGDHTTVNDIPPDSPSNMNDDNAGDFCLRYHEYTAFCKLIHICSWKVGDDVIEKWREICTNND
jgi:hypothetical protein